MQGALQALNNLEPDEQRRVLAWLAEKLNFGNARAVVSGNPVQPAFPRPGVGSGADGQATAKSFFVEKRPTTDVERVTCLAYYLSHYRGVTQFKTKDLTELSKEAAQPKFSNAAVAVHNATAQNQFLSAAGGGKKQITARGEALVEALPDQERVKTALQSIPLRGYRKAKPAKAAKTKRLA